MRFAGHVGAICEDGDFKVTHEAGSEHNLASVTEGRHEWFGGLIFAMEKKLEEIALRRLGFFLAAIRTNERRVRTNATIASAHDAQILHDVGGTGVNAAKEGGAAHHEARAVHMGRLIVRSKAQEMGVVGSSSVCCSSCSIDKLDIAWQVRPLLMAPFFPEKRGLLNHLTVVLVCYHERSCICHFEVGNDMKLNIIA